MGKSVVGPEMLDCSQLMSSLESSLACSISVLLEPGGYAGGSTLYINCLAASKELTPEGPLWSVATRHVWPHRDHKTFEGALYCALTALDSELAQQSFFKALNLK